MPSKGRLEVAERSVSSRSNSPALESTTLPSPQPEDPIDDQQSQPIGSEGEMGDEDELDEPETDIKGEIIGDEGMLGISEESEVRPPSSSGTRVGAVNKQQAAFVHKLFSMVQTPSLHSLIAWSENGSAFSVFNTTEFSRSVLPRFFKHNNFQSFVRQLNMYGFHKVNDLLGSAGSASIPEGGAAWEFQHTFFQRDKPELLSKIRRKASKGTSTPLGSSSRKSGSSTTVSTPGTVYTPSIPREKNSATAGSIPPTLERTEAESKSSRVVVSTQRPQSASSYKSHSRETPNEDVIPKRRDPFPSALPISAPTRRSSSALNLVPSRGSPPRPSSASLPQGGPPFPFMSQPGMQTNLRLSPAHSHFPIPPSTSYYYPPRSPSFEEPFARTMAELEARVHQLNEALYFSQQETLAGRVATYDVLRTMLALVASQGPNDGTEEQIDSISSAITQLDTEVASAAAGLQNLTSYPPTGLPNYPPTRPYSSAGRQPHPPGMSSSGPSYSQFFYQRAPVESYTRAGRPDSREGGGVGSGGGGDPHGYAAFVPGSSDGYPGPPSGLGTGGSASSSTGGPGLRDTPGASWSVPASRNYPSSAPYSSSYSGGTRLSWPSAATGGAEGGRPAKLPPFSSLLVEGQGRSGALDDDDIDGTGSARKKTRR